MLLNNIVVFTAKNSHPKTINDNRPEALTSLVKKSTSEKLIKKELLQRTDHPDPLQFACCATRGFRMQLQLCLTSFTSIYRVVKTTTICGLLLFSALSLSNTIQLHLLVQMLAECFGLDTNTVG